MTTKLICSIVFSLVCGLMITHAQAVGSKPPKTENVKKEQFALLVGINNYSTPMIRSLLGSENDVKLVRGVLTELYGFAPVTEIKELLSSNIKLSDKPTKSGILGAFKNHLIENAKKYQEKTGVAAKDGAAVLFYYSGHGSYLPDQPGSTEEADGLDETIVPMDSDLKGSRDIRDDDFDALYKELKQYTTNITFIFDSCHSGTVTRGTGSRGLERPRPQTASKPNGTDVTLNETMGGNPGYVTISGSLPNEKAQEDWMMNPDTRKMEMNGLMTYFLVQELRSSPDATYREIIQRVRTAVTKSISNQHPQAEGEIERVFLGSSTSRGRTSIKIKGVSKEGKDTILTIGAGRIAGAFPGGMVSIYDAKSRDLKGDAGFLTSGTITQSDSFEATVKVSTGNVPPNSKIVLANPYFSSEKRIVAIDTTLTGPGSEVMKDLAKSLKGNDYVQAIEVKSLADRILHPRSGPQIQKEWSVAVVRGKYKNFKSGSAQAAGSETVLPNDEEPIYYLAGQNGSSLYNFYIGSADPAASGKLQEVLENYVRVENLKALSNVGFAANSAFELRAVKLKSYEAAPNGRDCTVTEDDAAKNAVLNPGDLFYLEVVSKTTDKFYPYLYSIDPNGEIKLLYSGAGPEDVLGSSGLKTWTKKCRIFRATKSYGTETFKLIAASQPFEGRLLEQPAIAREGTRSGNASPLANLLARAATNTRSSVAPVMPPNSWTTASIDVEIREK